MIFLKRSGVVGAHKRGGFSALGDDVFHLVGGARGLDFHRLGLEVHLKKSFLWIDIFENYIKLFAFAKLLGKNSSDSSAAPAAGHGNIVSVNRHCFLEKFQFE